MRRLGWMLAAVICAVPFGCGPKKPPEETLPSVTLVERKRMDGSILLRFRLTHLDRVNWKGKVLRAQILKADADPSLAAVSFTEPGNEFEIEVVVGKVAESDGVFFVPRWGKSKNGVIVDSQQLEFTCPGGEINRVIVDGTQGRRITQILETCTGPGESISWRPAKGIDMLKLGYRPNAWVLKVWVSEKP